MINLQSKLFTTLSQDIDKYLIDSDLTPWKASLRSHTYVDGFLALLAHSEIDSIITEQGYSSFNEWLFDVEQWSNRLLDPRNGYGKGAMLLYELWDVFRNNITDVIKTARLHTNIPNKGGILAFVGGLSKCIVLEYFISSEYPRFTIIDVIDNPQSAFDFWGTIANAEMTAKNVLKEIISTGHKIILHRGILMHIDRRKDFQVFGPSVDTLLLAEIEAQSIYENNISKSSALEIGCGNGLLSVSVAKYLSGLKKIHSIDVNFHSVFCLYNNLTINITQHVLKNLNVYLTYGEFSGNFPNEKFDLVICNPPYIPNETTVQENINKKVDYYQAVGGTELIDVLLNNLDNLLTDTGELILLVSNLSLELTLALIPPNFKYELILKDGHKVLFDVEAVLKKESWLRYLLENCGLIQEEDLFYHFIYPIIIKR
jgi:methylase of polypeptide subunit release factors